MNRWVRCSASPAHADANVQITGPAAAQQVGVPFDYTITLPDIGNRYFEVYFQLSGAAATFTSAYTINASPPDIQCGVEPGSTSGYCARDATAADLGDIPIVVTVLPAETASSRQVPPGSGSTPPSVSWSSSATAPPRPSVAAHPIGRPERHRRGLGRPGRFGDTYTYTVTNNGPDTTAGVSAVTALSGAAATIVSAASNQGSCTIAASTVTCSIGSLANAASATVSITVDPQATGSITATATVSGTEDDPVTGNNTDAETTTISNTHGWAKPTEPHRTVVHGCCPRPTWSSSSASASVG